MSLFGAEFFRTLKERFGPEADVLFVPNGYLVLASAEGAEQLTNNHKLQTELGAKNLLLSKNQLTEKYNSNFAPIILLGNGTVSMVTANLIGALLIQTIRSPLVACKNAFSWRKLNKNPVFRTQFFNIVYEKCC